MTPSRPPAEPQEVADNRDRRNSIRMVLEALILAALLWTGSTLVELTVQMATVQAQMVALTAQMTDAPAMYRQIAVNTARLDRVEVALGMRGSK